jgi:hypothetical protein
MILQVFSSICYLLPMLYAQWFLRRVLPDQVDFSNKVVYGVAVRWFMLEELLMVGQIIFGSIFVLFSWCINL